MFMKRFSISCKLFVMGIGWKVTKKTAKKFRKTIDFIMLKW